MSEAAELFARVRAQLGAHGVDDAAHVARLLVCELGGVSLSELVTGPAKPLPPQTVSAIEAAIVRLAHGEPLFRILGAREFYGLRLKLSDATLEPRPDTETLVELVLPFVRETAAKKGACAIIDLGTGSGAIALALLSAEPMATAFGTDISPQALETAMTNAAALGLAGRFKVQASDWFTAVTGRFDLIVSNPPYIASGDLAGLGKGVREHDPAAALDGGPDGLAAYRRLAADASAHLAEGGRIGVETGFDQREDVGGIFAAKGFLLVEARRDLGGNDRAMLFSAGNDPAASQ